MSPALGQALGLLSAVGHGNQPLGALLLLLGGLAGVLVYVCWLTWAGRRARDRRGADLVLNGRRPSRVDPDPWVEAAASMLAASEDRTAWPPYVEPVYNTMHFRETTACTDLPVEPGMPHRANHAGGWE